MENFVDVVKALESMNGKRINGSMVLVSWAKGKDHVPLNQHSYGATAAAGYEVHAISSQEIQVFTAKLGILNDIYERKEELPRNSRASIRSRMRNLKALNAQSMEIM